MTERNTMKIVISRIDKPDGTSEIGCGKNFDVKDASEIATIMMMLKEIEFELMAKWIKMREEEFSSSQPTKFSL